jgi:hypothetical protein
MVDSDDSKGPMGRINDKYLIDEGDDFVTYDPEGAEKVEFVVKTLLAKDRLSADQSENTWDIEVITLQRLYNEVINEENFSKNFRDQLIEEYGELDDDQQDAIDIVYRVQASDSVVLFYTLANELIHGLGAELLVSSILEEGDSELEFARSLDKEDLINLLYYSGEINKKMKDESINARITRNKLVHEFRERHYLDSIQDIIPMMKRVCDVIDEFHDKVVGGKPFDDLNEN